MEGPIERIIARLRGMLHAADGLAARYSQRRLAAAPDELPDFVEIAEVHLPGKLAAQQGGHCYPAVYIYAKEWRNDLSEKFNKVCGKLTAIVELQVSAPKVEESRKALHVLLEETLALLQESRGCWEEGLSYGGEYSVVLEPPQIGGKGYEHIARISVPVHTAR